MTANRAGVLAVVLVSTLFFASPGRAIVGTRAARKTLKRQSTARIASARRAYQISLALLSAGRERLKPSTGGRSGWPWPNWRRRRPPAES